MTSYPRQPGRSQEGQGLPTDHTNPFALGGWQGNGQQPVWLSMNPHSPTYGALPPSTVMPSTQTFEFMFDPDLMNCLVKGDQERIFFKIETIIPETTVIFRGQEPYAFIQWHKHPTIQTTNHSIARQPTGDFLKLSEDGKYRCMNVARRQYVWVVRESGVYLYTTNSPPSQLARISFNSSNTKITLKIANEAFQFGLFEPCVVSVVLLFCNRSID